MIAQIMPPRTGAAPEVSRAGATRPASHTSPPQATPVLPAGWAPLSGEEQEHLLEACERAPECIVFCLTSAWTGDAEYRAYRLSDEAWGGLWVAAMWTRPARREASRQLLAAGHDPRRVVATAIQCFSVQLDARCSAASSAPDAD